MPPIPARVYLGVIIMKGYSAFPKVPAYEASPSDCLQSYPEHSLGGSYSASEMQSVSFAAASPLG